MVLDTGANQNEDLRISRWKYDDNTNLKHIPVRPL